MEHRISAESQISEGSDSVFYDDSVDMDCLLFSTGQRVDSFGTISQVGSIRSLESFSPEFEEVQDEIEGQMLARCYTAPLMAPPPKQHDKKKTAKHKLKEAKQAKSQEKVFVIKRKSR